MRNTFITATVLALGTTLPATGFATDIAVKARASINGSSETRMADRTYDVKVRGNRNDSRSDVYDEALYEAARKTRKKDYDWFRVIESDIERDRRRVENGTAFEAGYERVPYRTCGLLTCRTEYRTEKRTSVTLDFDDREDTRYTVELEFQVGWGPMPTDGEVYDARRAEQMYR